MKKALNPLLTEKELIIPDSGDGNILWYFLKSTMKRRN